MSKRTFTQIGGNKVFRPWGHWTEGDSIVGKFTGTSEDSFGNTNYEIEVEELEFDEQEVKSKKANGEEIILRAPKAGEIFVLNACGSLDRAMENCSEGDIIKVIYTGTIILNKGKFKGKEAHTMKVLRADRPGGVAKSTVALNDESDEVEL